MAYQSILKLSGLSEPTLDPLDSIVASIAPAHLRDIPGTSICMALPVLPTTNCWVRVNGVWKKATMSGA